MKILDATCGTKSIWYQKNHPFVTFMDKRSGSYLKFTDNMCLRSRRNLKVNPDVVADWTKRIPFEDNEFDMVVFDPPHIVQDSDGALTIFYGRLSKDSYRQDLMKGIKELFRVLKPNGVFILKWCESGGKKIDEILKLFPYPPMFGTRTGQDNSNHWVCFIKYDVNMKLDEMIT